MEKKPVALFWMADFHPAQTDFVWAIAWFDYDPRQRDITLVENKVHGPVDQFVSCESLDRQKDQPGQFVTVHRSPCLSKVVGSFAADSVGHLVEHPTPSERTGR